MCYSAVPPLPATDPHNMSSTGFLRARRGARTLTLIAILPALTACPDTAVSTQPAASKPSAPTIGTVTAGNAQLSVAFTASSSDGGSPIINYIAICTSGTFSISNSSLTSPIVVTGLANGTSYNCSVAAMNAVGTGPSSSSASGIPFTTPSAPTIGVVTAGNGTASIAF